MAFDKIGKKKIFRESAVILVMTGLLILLGWWIVILNLESRRAADHERTTLNASRISNSLAYGVARVASELDTLLLFMRAMRNVRDESVTWQEIVTDHYTINRQTVQIAIMAKNGMMVTSSKMLYPKKPIDLSDRAHYKVHVNSGRDELYISVPVLGRASKKWSIQFTRPLFDKQGAFSGVIVVSLGLSKIDELFSGIQMGTGYGIALLGHDGVIRAGAGHFANQIGKNAPASLLSASDSRANTFPPNLITSIQPLQHYPLRIVVSAPHPGLLGWYWSNKVYLLALGIGTLIILAGTLFLTMQRQKHMSLMLERRRLELQREIANRTSRMKSDFLSVMSHEIRTPLNGIIGSLELVTTDNMSAPTIKQIDIARSSSFYLLGLIDDILVFMKSDGGDVKLDEQFHSIRNLYSDVSRSLSQAVHLSKNKLSIEVGNDVPDIIKFDVVKFRQVITNLLGNANKFTHEGKLTLRTSLIGCDAGIAKIRISVIDTGIGIPKAKHDAIFERFTSLDSSLSRRSDGTGLGLTICKTIINSMGSDITIDSDLGKGSSFSFELALPVAASDGLADANNVTIDHHQCRGLKILLAEDNETNAYIATEFLSAQDHTVDRACDGNEAIVAAQSEKYDIILMDISMPERDGLAAAKAIRSGDNPNVDTPIIALTAHASSETGKWIESAGMNNYLTKPISRERLLDAVQRYHGANRPIEDRLDEFDRDRAESAAGDLPIMNGDQFNEFVANYDAEKTAKLLSLLLGDLSRNKSKLKEAIEAQDENDARRIAHALLGSTSAVGAERLSTCCQEVEHSSDTDQGFNWDNCISLIDLIDLTTAEVERTLEDLHVEKKEPELTTV